MPESIFDLFESYIGAHNLFSEKEIAITKFMAIPKQLKNLAAITEQN